MSIQSTHTRQTRRPALASHSKFTAKSTVSFHGAQVTDSGPCSYAAPLSADSSDSFSTAVSP